MDVVIFYLHVLYTVLFHRSFQGAALEYATNVSCVLHSMTMWIKGLAGSTFPSGLVKMWVHIYLEAYLRRKKDRIAGPKALITGLACRKGRM